MKNMDNLIFRNELIGINYNYLSVSMKLNKNNTIL